MVFVPMVIERYAKLTEKVLASSRLRSVALLVVLLLVVVGITRCKTTWFNETAYASQAVDWYLHDETSVTRNIDSRVGWNRIVHVDSLSHC